MRVETKPGATALTSTPWRDNSIASVRVAWSSPPFAAPPPPPGRRGARRSPGRCRSPRRSRARAARRAVSPRHRALCWNDAMRALAIASVETIPIRVPLVRPFHGSHYHMTHRSTIVVRITTDDGIVGEAYAGDEDASLLEIDRIVNDELAPKLVGEDAYAIERCWELCRPATFDILRDRRIGLVACACVDAALWDAVGKALAQPLWRLWGGYRSRLPMIAIGGYYDAGADLRTEVNGLLELGVGGMKLKIGGLDPDADAVRARTVREEAGDSFI